MVLEKKVAVVDDDADMGLAIRDILKAEGYTVSQYTSASQALIDFKKNIPNILITDLNMKEIDGMMFLKKVQVDYPSVVSIMMTAFGSIETAVEATKLGAYHYIVKPFKMEDFTLLVKRAMERSELVAENKTLKRELRKEFSVDSIIGKSQIMLDLFDLIKRVAPATANVLISGESGTGKELVARAIHNLSPRAKKSFVPINCTAIPEQLLESELFGHTKGSFTGAISDRKGLFEEAHGGTLFLDEIGDMSLPLQAKLLRVLQEKEIRSVGGNALKEIDVRIVSASHRNLKELIKEGKFREDLFYRLNVVPIHSPSLRERTQDIPLLAEFFLQKFSLRNHSKVRKITPEAMAKLIAHPWRGNVRELENVIERAIVLCRTDELEEADILGSALESAKEDLAGIYEDNPTLDKLEERYIKLILNQYGSRKDDAAKALGINRRTLYRKEKEYGLAAEGAAEPAED